MVFLKHGKYELPDDLFYDKVQYLFLDAHKKTMGITDVGYSIHGVPDKITFLAEDVLAIGQPFVELQINSTKKILTSPCGGKIVALNPDGINFREYDTYSKGFLVQLENVDESTPDLIGGNDIEIWANELENSVLPEEYSFKFVVVGDNESGKSAVCRRIINNSFQEENAPTLHLNMDSALRMIPAKSIYGSGAADKNISVRISLWDIGSDAPGMERSMYYSGADAVLLVFNLNNPTSFESLKKWREETEEMLSPRIPTVVVGNKSDLPLKVDRTAIESFAAEHCSSILYCSAKTGEGISTIIDQIIKTLIIAQKM